MYRCYRIGVFVDLLCLRVALSFLTFSAFLSVCVVTCFRAFISSVNFIVDVYSSSVMSMRLLKCLATSFDSSFCVRSDSEMFSNCMICATSSLVTSMDVV